MNKSMIIRIPSFAFDIQIVKSKDWYLKYSVSKEAAKMILIGKPCEIEMLCRNHNKLYAVLNIYNSKEY